MDNRMNHAHIHTPEVDLLMHDDATRCACLHPLRVHRHDRLGGAGACLFKECGCFAFAPLKFVGLSP
jgi:hypothetical protein